MSLTFKYDLCKMIKQTLDVPVLTGYVLHKITFDSNKYNLEFVLRVGTGQTNDIIKLQPAYFMNNNEILLNDYLYRLNETEKIFIDITLKENSKPMEITYHYKETEGILYYQNTLKCDLLENNTILKDITQQITPNKLKISIDSGVHIKELSLLPLFRSNVFSGASFEYVKKFNDESCYEYILDFKNVSKEILTLLAYYKLNIVLENNNKNEPVDINKNVYILAYGYKG